jgi:hypothetical protein
MKRRFVDSDFNRKDELEVKSDNVIDLDDLRGLFKEFVVMKMEEDFEVMLKNYFNKKLK